MKTNVLQLHDVNPEDYKNEILTGVEQKLEAFRASLQLNQKNKYVTRKEVAKLLGVSLVTIHDWCNKGILKPFRIGSSVRFKLQEIEDILNKSRDESTD